ncbi:TetR/AcrR family transcriptional regulator [Luteipulveratus mongoliensis]|uniref:HTH tetR-type domain-containing protein n=1 Tax=Luteipulveratus mongoliensis TaxID=571913 RepID=A0A0K1JGZ3_9MICO|nr:TetR/AcrR family transcriptional regulator [Luteipulveratus mongoliensis]AKU15853.1 hypothetical protein VV02_08295 [Luteipulveratus mongoliensis]
MASEQPLRADARRNRDRLLVATRTLLAQRGTAVSMDEIARTAGVGSGTLYRHFPDRTRLLTAVLADRIQTVIEAIEAAADIEDPEVALRTALHEFGSVVAADRAVTELLIAEHVVELPDNDALQVRALELLEGIVARAHAAGVLRTDIAATDLPPLIVAAVRAPLPGLGDTEDPDLWERYLQVISDGLRPSAASTPLPHHAPPMPGLSRDQTRDAG